jgi:eukaryotic-like serine/threonine-protein kinase
VQVSTKLIDPSSGVVQRIGRYDLVAEIASGGMATVYLARLSGVGGFQRNVAIKCLHPHLARNLEFVEMFLDEARLAALIHHPNVVPIQEVEESDQGYYLVMDYVEGDTFASLLSRSASLGRQVPREIALRIVIDTLTGLDAAHELRDDHARGVGLVHRDVSPQNILVGTDGVARITDFGVARAASRLSATRAGQLKGKLAYMAPEQAGGEEEVDRRADVFSAGVVLWEALAFRRLFKASNEAATLTRVLTETIVPPNEINPEVPEVISRVCMKALERDLNRRYVSCAEFADALERAAKSVGALASTREVAAFVLDVVGEDVESHRRAIRQWLDRRERSQAGMAALARERSIAPPAPSRPSQVGFGSGEFAAERSGLPTPGRPPSLGRLPPPSRGLGSARPPGSGHVDMSSAWPGSALPTVPPPRYPAELTVPSAGVPPPMAPSSYGGDEPRMSRAAALLSMPSGSPSPSLQPPFGSAASAGAPSSAPQLGTFAVAPASSAGAGTSFDAGLSSHGTSAVDAAPPRRSRRAWTLAAITLFFLILSFGLTWSLTDDRSAGDDKATLPLRTNATPSAGVGPAGASPKPVSENAVREPGKAPDPPKQAEVTPKVVTPAAAAASVERPDVAGPAATPAENTVKSGGRVVRTPAAPRKPAPPATPKAAAQDLENPYQ